MAQIILVINANASHAAELQQHICKEMKLETTCAASGEEALHAMANGTIPQPDAVLLDAAQCQFPLDIIRAIRSLRNDVQVITLFDFAHVETAMESMAHGAADFLLKPFHVAQLTTSIRNALIRRDLQLEARQACIGLHISLEDMKPQSAILKATLQMARSLAHSNSPLMLEGASGTGREMLARAIHNFSPRKEKAFITINASSLLHDETDRTFFGDGQNIGALSKVKNGTLFIRNIDSLSEAMRQKILLAVKGEIPVGNTYPDEQFCGRLVFAVSDNARRLSHKEKNGISQFFSLLNIALISFPYLREIPEDILMLAQLHCRRYAAHEGKEIIGISHAAGQMLQEMSWPGNMGQLSQSVFNAVMCCQGNELEVKDFRYLFRPQLAEITYLPEWKTTLEASFLQSRIDGLMKCVDEAGNMKRLQDIEEEMIRYALKRYNGHMSDIARHLGIGRSTLYRKISSMEEGGETAIAPARTRRLGQ